VAQVETQPAARRHAEETNQVGSPDDLARRVAELEERLASSADPAVRELADELVCAVMDLYGEGLERIFRALADGGTAGVALRDALLEDAVVAGLLFIHDLHPVPLETRVEAALESVRPYLRSHKGDVELVGLEDGVAHLRLQGSCDGCPSSASTLELAITQALEEAAPDLVGIEVDGAVAQPSFSRGSLPLVGAGEPAASPSDWTYVDGLDDLEPDTMREADVGGNDLLIANVGGTLLAYVNSCAGCGSQLGAGVLEYGVLECPGCRRSFQLPLAGRILGGSEPLQLSPVPLLAENGGARVSVPAAGSGRGG